MRSNASPETAVAAVAAASLEAAWITLIYVTVAALATQTAAPLPLLAFALAAFVGLVLSRWIGVDRRDRDRTLLAGIAIGVACAGWLLPFGLDAARVIDQPYLLLEMHPGGLLLGVALLRGTAHVTPRDDERIAETALGPGIVIVALIWVVLAAAGVTSDPAVLGDAYAATLTCVTAALLSMALARLADLRTTDDGQSGRRTWVGLLVALIAGLLVVAMPLALVIGAPVDAAVRGVLGPLAEVLLPIAMLLILPGALLVGALVAAIEWTRGGQPTGTIPEFRLNGLPRLDFGNPVGPSGTELVVLGLVPLVVAVIAAFLVVRTLLHRTGHFIPAGGAAEIREIERPVGGMRLPRLRRPKSRRARVPETASDAYLASIELLGQTPVSARLASETPREHARRIGSDPTWSPLRRLAADYALAEFGRRRLTAAEHRRAIEVWRRLQAAVRERRRRLEAEEGR